jgi:hypothetical protein
MENETARRRPHRSVVWAERERTHGIAWRRCGWHAGFYGSGADQPCIWWERLDVGVDAAALQVTVVAVTEVDLVHTALRQEGQHTVVCSCSIRRRMDQEGGMRRESYSCPGIMLEEMLQHGWCAVGDHTPQVQDVRHAVESAEASPACARQLHLSVYIIHNLLLHNKAHMIVPNVVPRPPALNTI